MNRRSMNILLPLAVIAGLFGVAGWSVSEMFAAQTDARRAAETLGQCAEVARQIERLRDGPEIASNQAIDTQLIARRVQDSAKKAGFNDIELIDSDPARRIGDSAYLRQPTTVSLRGVTLQQTAVFLYHLTDDPRMTVGELRLRSPHDQLTGRQWNVEATAYYLIYSPPDED